MSKFDEILNSSDASDALLWEQIDALEERLEARIDDCATASEVRALEVDNLDKIPVNYMGKMVLKANVSPSIAVLTGIGLCYGESSGWRVIFVSRVSTAETFVNYRYNNAWSGWKKITTA